jgi:hypothetical protein
LLLPCYHMHDERLKIKHENGHSNLDEMWHSLHVQEKRKMEGAWDFCQGCTIWCYFETSFLWPPDQYFFLNLKSKARWGKEKIKQYLEIKHGMKLTRKLAGNREAILTAISNNPLNEPVKPGSNGVKPAPVAVEGVQVAIEKERVPDDELTGIPLTTADESGGVAVKIETSNRN